ncbi:MAG: hypothetical protein P4L57_09790 [Rhizomicrobium sp.]|nr:hypothetical protein [Rhizomicrobium sp.]
MTRFSQAIVNVVLLLLAIASGWFAIPHWRDGVAIGDAIPVPAYMVAQIPMPKLAYDDAVHALGRADPENGWAHIARAEAARQYGGAPQTQISEIERGLSLTPASSRGWTLLSEAWLPTDQRLAAKMLSQALLLGPNDFWLIGPRVQDAAVLWPYLDQDSKDLALAQTRMLWEVPVLRGQLRVLLRSADGVNLASRAFKNRQEEVRQMNRWLSLDRQREATMP